MEKVFFIDAYALIFRSYYAFMSRPMRNAEGLNTSAIFGFVKFLNEIIRREQPHYLGVAFDPKGGNFRHTLYPQYKANREATPEDIIAAVPYIKEILEAMQIPILEIPGYEADDVIGTLAHKAAGAEFEVFMVTPDKDFGQLITPQIRIYKQRKGGEGIDIVGCEEIEAQYGIQDPKQVIDILALWGDAADNIPGVPGVGEKGATKLVREYGSIENLLEHTHQLKGKQKEHVEQCADQIRLAKQLATIKLDVPIEFEPERLVMEGPDLELLTSLYQQLGFRSLISELQNESRFRIGGGTIAGTSAASTSAASLAGTTGIALPGIAGGVLPASGSSGRAQGFAPAPSVLQGDLFAGSLPAVEAAGEKVFRGAQAPLPAASTLRHEAEGDSFETIHTLAHTYHTVTTPQELEELVDRLRVAEAFCFDTETAGFDIFNDAMVGLSFALAPHEAWYVPCHAANRTQILAALSPLFENEKIAKIGQNLKFDLMVLRAAGVAVRGALYDTMIIHYLLDPESRHGMDHLARTYLGYSPVPIESLIGKGAKQLTMDRLPVEVVAPYAAEDADVTLRLKEKLWPLLEQAGQVELYRKIEEPMIRVLADVEMTGVKIDVAVLEVSGGLLSKELAGLEAQIREMIGDPLLNVNSAKQLGEGLFGRLKIDHKPKMTKTKQYRTDEEYLQMLTDRHPVVELILEYRGLRKLLSTYVEALPLLVNSKTGRIHTSYNQAVTSTGRLSSTNPNLQNIPIRDERGREIRKAFIPSMPERLLLSADYSQVELRLMAHLSGDESMIAAFAAGIDIHTATAARLFGVTPQEVTSEQRRKAKTANFGIIYGISPFGLAQRLNIPRTEAREIIDGYFSAFPGVKTYMERVVEQAEERGYVSTLFGRKRMLPDINSRNAVVRGLSQRNAINAPIQGGAADIMKIAMVDLHNRLAQEGLSSQIIMQVHDELVIDLVPHEEQQVRQLVQQCMSGAAQLGVELVVDCGVGKNWVEAH